MSSESNIHTPSPEVQEPSSPRILDVRRKYGWIPIRISIIPKSLLPKPFLSESKFN
jgi:hypothetical protein